MLDLSRQRYYTKCCWVLTCVAACALVLLLDVGWRYARAFDLDLIRARVEKMYGLAGESAQRFDAWQTLLEEQRSKSEVEQLQAVNRFFNMRLRFRDDQELWRVADYWATPVEALIKGAADCEDFAIAKYFSLRELGIPSEKLRITYVKALALDQAHMVLTYYPQPNATPLVLDNLIDAIRPANERKDLLPVYAFNAEGLWMGGGASRHVGDSKRLSRWQDLLRKMRSEGFP